jgi:hypothetical protein
MWSAIICSIAPLAEYVSEAILSEWRQRAYNKAVEGGTSALAAPTAEAGPLAIQAVAPFLGLEVTPINVRDTDEIERAVTDFARSPNGGLIITGSALAIVHRHLIVTLAAKHQLPAIYFQRALVADGGLISYGADLLDQYRRAASYVDRMHAENDTAEIMS